MANRKKQGFTVPVWNWLTAGWRPQLDALAENSLLEREGWIQPGAMRQAASAAYAKGRAPVQLWTLAVLENWLQARKAGAAARIPHQVS